MGLTNINRRNTRTRFLNVRYFITCIVLKKINFQIFNPLLITLLIFTGLVSESEGQTYEAGGGLGTSVYTGDIVRKIDPNQLGLQGTLFGKRNFDNVWTLRVSLTAATLGAKDSISPIDRAAEVRDAYFHGTLLEGTAVMEFNFLDYLRNDSEFPFSPYAFFGLGYTHLFAKGNTFAYNPSESYNEGTVIIPFGGGVKYRLNDHLTLAVEAGIRATFTDYLDKIDSMDPPIPRFKDPTNTSQPYGINFGNPYDNDWYYFLGLTISYAFESTKCYAY